MTAYAKDYPNRIQSLKYVHCATDTKSTLQSHIDTFIYDYLFILTVVPYYSLFVLKRPTNTTVENCPYD